MSVTKFEKSALNDPNMTLKTTKSKVPHIFLESNSRYLLSLKLKSVSLLSCLWPACLWPAVFELQAILRHAQNGPKMA